MLVNESGYIILGFSTKLFNNEPAGIFRHSCADLSCKPVYIVMIQLNFKNTKTEKDEQ